MRTMMNFETFVKELGAGGNAAAAGGAASINRQTAEFSRVWQQLTDYLAKNPTVWVAALQQSQQTQMDILSKLQDKQVAVTPDKGDRRFANAQWTDNAFFSFLMQNYLANARIFRAVIAEANLPDKDRSILMFMVNQYIDAMAPTNFPATNPEVIEESIKTGGDNLARGAQNFISDMQSGMVKNTDLAAFTVGDNIATSAGKVVFQNHLMQLIEYTPAAAKTRERPLLIIPPCINKYYILDLTAEKSLVRHLTANNQRVFLLSWVNAGGDIAHIRWDDYLRDGVMAAIETVCAISKRADINTLGFCVGGTLLASALAALAAGGERPAHTMTLLAAMLDFSDTGEIGLFINEDSVAEREREFAAGGLIDGRELARGFAMMRPNDLVWPYVINNYYQGKEPAAFDLLFWNSDSTNLPGPMFAEYLRMTYLENQIARGEATMCGEKIDLAAIACPVYAVACEKDHIVPWQTAYESARLVDGKSRFVLAASGHIAGIINPPATGKGWHRVTAAAAAKKPLPKDAEAWRAAAQTREGSWWADWTAWLAAHSGKLVAAPKRQGSMRYAPIEDAPGAYVCAPRPPISISISPTSQE